MLVLRAVWFGSGRGLIQLEQMGLAVGVVVRCGGVVGVVGPGLGFAPRASGDVVDAEGACGAVGWQDFVEAIA